MSDNDATIKQHIGVYFAMQPSDPFLVVSVPGCGTTVNYAVNEIPMHDVPCPCGDPTHWLVKWQAPK